MSDWIARTLGFAWTDLRTGERALAWVVLAVLVLLAGAVLFAVLVVAARARHVRQRRRREEMERRWRAPVVEVLTEGRDPETVRALVQPGEEVAFLTVLLGFARRVRGAEAGVLGVLASPHLPAVDRVLRRRSPEVRALGVQILAVFGMPAFAPRLLAALDDRSPYVAMAVAQALARREHAEHGEAVVRRLGRFTSWSVEYLGAMLARVGPALAPSLRAVLADGGQPPRARAIAAEALRRLNDPLAAEEASRALTACDPRADGPATVLAAAALRLLEGVGRPEHARTVRRFLSCEDAVLRAEAIGALAVVGGGGDTRVLEHALDDASPLVARRAAQGLLRIGRSDLVEAAVDRPGVGLLARQALAERAAR